eukprot:COSAG02_NODE_12160_length_1586_cov_109.347007_2_plen_60_part_01
MNLYSEVMVAKLVHAFFCKLQADHHVLDGTGWKPWLQHLNGSEASAEQLKANGNDAFKSG